MRQKKMESNDYMIIFDSVKTFVISVKPQNRAMSFNFSYEYYSRGVHTLAGSGPARRKFDKLAQHAERTIFCRILNTLSMVRVGQA